MYAMQHGDRSVVVATAKPFADAIMLFLCRDHRVSGPQLSVVAKRPGHPHALVRGRLPGNAVAAADWTLLKPLTTRLEHPRTDDGRRRRGGRGMSGSLRDQPTTRCVTVRCDPAVCLCELAWTLRLYFFVDLLHVDYMANFYSIPFYPPSYTLCWHGYRSVSMQCFQNVCLLQQPDYTIVALSSPFNGGVRALRPRTKQVLGDGMTAGTPIDPQVTIFSFQRRSLISRYF